MRGGLPSTLFVPIDGRLEPVSGRQRSQRRPPADEAENAKELAMRWQALEAAAFALQPLTIGLAVDDLLAGSYRGLGWLAAQTAAAALFGMLRRSSAASESRWSAASQLIARSIACACAVAIIGWHDAELLPLLVLYALPAWLVSLAEHRRRQLTSSSADAAVAEALMAKASDEDLPGRGESCGNPSRGCGFSFGLRELFAAGMLLVALLHCTAKPHLTPGELFAVVSSLAMFARNWPPLSIHD